MYTPSGTTRELVIVSSNQNVVRVIDGLTGKLVASKILDAPFASVDSNCNDVEGTVGITGTSVCDRVFLPIFLSLPHHAYSLENKTRKQPSTYTND